jgi:hypothetical protein
VSGSESLQGINLALTHVNERCVWASALAGKVLGSELKAHSFLTKRLRLMLSRLDSQGVARRYATGGVVVDIA